MRTLSSNWTNHLSGQVTTLATLWKLTRKDGVILGFTNHTDDIIYGGVTYKASSGYTPSAISDSVGLKVDNLNVDGLLDSSAITEADLMNGKYDYATVEIYYINYAATADGVIQLKKGVLGEVTSRDQMFSAEIRGFAQVLQQQQGRVYSPICDADLGDTRCKVSLAAITYTGTVNSVGSNTYAQFGSIDNTSIWQAADSWFNYGVITWLSGANTGLKKEVKAFSAGAFTLVENLPYAIVIGDTFTVHPGCDKLHTTCINKFNNIINFRGFTTIPGSDSLLQYGTN